jgi:hypothetical protein
MKPADKKGLTMPEVETVFVADDMLGGSANPAKRFLGSCKI